jgi:hypothetical protein
MTTDAPVGRRRTVRLVDVPVALYREAEQHADDLQRELLLMAGYESARGLPGRATDLQRRADTHRDARLALSMAAAPEVSRGTGTVTLVYDVTLDAATTAEEWARLVDDVAVLCRSGEMLMVPARPEVAEFSRWFCAEFVGQLRDGRAPTPWPAYAAAVTP